MEQLAHPIEHPSVKEYFKKTVPILLIVSTAITAVFEVGQVEMVFAVELLQLFVFAYLVELVMRGGRANGTRQDNANGVRTKSYAILTICALSAFGLSLLVTSRIGTIHAIFPIIFPALATAFGGKLAVANGRRVDRVLTDPAMRFLTTSTIAVAFSVVGFAFSISLWRTGFFYAAPYPMKIAAFAVELFIQLFPFAVYAMVLRRSFVLDGDEVSPIENA